MQIKGRVLVGVTLGILLATSAHAMYVMDNPYEMKCAAGASKGLAKFTGAKAKCITKCWQLYRKGLVPASDCQAPYGGATQICIADPLKGAEAKAAASINKGCVIDCPECYSPNCPTYITNRVNNTEAQLDGFASLVWCTEPTAPTAAEAKCEDTVGKVLAKFVASKGKCYDKCIGNEFKGKLPPYSCLPPNPADALTQACIALAEQKAAAGIDKLCAGVSANPACYVPNFDTGAEWVAVAEAAVDSNTTQTYCGSPSGAFVE